MHMYPSSRPQTFRDANSTQALAIIRAEDLRNEERRARKEARAEFLRKLFKKN